MTIHFSHFVILISMLLCVKSAVSAIFENVSVVLSSDGIFEEIVFIRSDDNLQPYINKLATEVKIAHQKVSKLGKNSITNLTEVVYLHIVHCGLKEISPGAFENLPKLQELNLGNNRLTEIKNGVFDGLTFDTLYLENNRLKKIEDKAFNSLRMEFLFVDNNRINSWNSGWFRGTPLTSISIRNNSLEELPARSFQFLWPFKNPSHHLDLFYFLADDNGMGKVSSDAFEGIQEIAHLSLKNNNLEKLEPGVFGSVERIHSIELGNNNIKELDSEAFKNTIFDEVNLRNNQLSCIWTEILEVTKLSKLHIDDNPITCDCILSWQEWMKQNKKIKIDNFYKLEENCINNSENLKDPFITFFFLVLCILFL